MEDILNNDAVLVAIGAVIGAIAIPVFKWAKAKVAKTENTVDDALVAAAEKALNDAIAKFLKKKEAAAAKAAETKTDAS